VRYDKKMYVGLHVKYRYCYFILVKLGSLLSDFQKQLKY